MRKRIKLGIIGIGHMGFYHVKIATSIPVYQIVGIYDCNLERSHQVAEEFDIPVFDNPQQLIEKADGIIVAVPTKNHYEMAKLALENGCHLLVEKPMTETIEQAEELVALAQKHNKILQVGQVERFNGAVRELMKIIDNPILVEARRISQFNSRIQDVGVVLDMMIHDIDIVVNLVQGDVIGIEAYGTSILSENPRLEDIAIATLIFDTGCIATILGNRISQMKIRHLNVTQKKNYISLDFSRQDIDIYRQANSENTIFTGESSVKYKQEFLIEKINVHRDNPLKQEHEHFVSCIYGKNQPLVSGLNDIRILRIAKKIIETIQQSKPHQFGRF